jgi:hypothetical protein
MYFVLQNKNEDSATKIIIHYANIIFFLIPIVGGGVQTGSTRRVGHFWPIVLAPSDCEDGEFGGMKTGTGNRSTRRNPTPAPLCPPQISLDQTRARTPFVAVESWRTICNVLSDSNCHTNHIKRLFIMRSS